MSSEFVKKENNNVSLKVTVSDEAFKEAIKKAYLKNRGRFNIPGFRKGKAPQKVIELQYGVGVFYDDAINLAFPVEYEKAVEELGLEPVGRPDVDIETLELGEPVIFTVDVIVKPEVVLGAYDSIEVEKVSSDVTDEEVDAEMEKSRDMNSRLVSIEDEAKNGDTAMIDYEGFVGEEAFEGGKGENHPLELGSNQFIPGFEEQIVGCKAGEEKEIKVTFPDDYHSDELAGAEATFKVVVKEVKRKELPELDDELAKDISEFDTLEELKADTRAKMEDEADKRAKSEIRNKVIEKAVSISEIDLPEVMVENEIDSMIKDFGYQLKYQGLDLDKYYEITQSEEKDLREQMKEDAEKKAKTGLTVEAISKKEAVEASEEELEAEMEKIAEQYKMELDKVKMTYSGENLEYLKESIVSRKTIDLLVEKTKLV
ncbi:MAG: trigger factor [Peptostreptococcaceae bacterium]|nr:trigger factor [Peptostreptococcaceae bacterium]